MACYSAVDVVCEVIIANEDCVVEVRIIGHQEEDARGEEFVVDAVALYKD